MAMRHMLRLFLNSNHTTHRYRTAHTVNGLKTQSVSHACLHRTLPYHTVYAIFHFGTFH